MPGINVGSSFNPSSPQPTNLKAYFATASQRRGAAQLRHVSWKYFQADTGAFYSIKPLAQCFLSDGTTPATQNGTWGTLEAHWIKDLVLADVQSLVNAVGATLTPGKIAYVEGNTNNTLTPRLGDALRPYQTLGAAAAAVGVGGTVIVRPGGLETDSLGRQCYNESEITITTSIHVVCLPGVVFGANANINLGGYGTNASIRSTWTGGIILKAINVLRQQFLPYYVVLTGVKTEGVGLLQGFSQCPGGSTSTHTDILELRNCWGRNTTTCCAAMTGNENFGYQRLEMSLWDCDFQAASVAPLKITPHTVVDLNASKLFRRGSTRLVNLAGSPVEIANTALSGPVNPDYVLIDQRVVPDVPASLYGQTLSLQVSSVGKKVWVTAVSNGPTLGTPNPSSGVIGSVITLPGTNLGSATALTLNGTNIFSSISANTNTLITLTLPVGATSGVFEVTTSNGSATSDAFSVLTRRFMTDGDSLEGQGYQGGGANPSDLSDFFATLSWRGELKNLLPASYSDFRNWGHSGQGLDYMLGQFDDITGPAILANAGMPQGMFVGGGINDFLFSNATPQQVYDKKKLYIQKCRALDPDILIFTATLTPADATTWGNKTQLQLDTLLQEYNDMVYNGQLDMDYQGLFDWSNNPLLDYAVTPGNSNDHLHFLVGGNQAKADQALPVVEAVFLANGNVAPEARDFTPPLSDLQLYYDTKPGSYSGNDRLDSSGNNHTMVQLNVSKHTVGGQVRTVFNATGSASSAGIAGNPQNGYVGPADYSIVVELSHVALTDDNIAIRMANKGFGFALAGTGMCFDGNFYTSGTAISDNTMCRIVFVRDQAAGKTKMYINGTYINQFNQGDQPYADFYFGDFAGSLPFHGEMGRFAFYTRQLTPTEITAWQQAPL